jgi:hypothetical protein
MKLKLLFTCLSISILSSKAFAQDCKLIVDNFSRLGCYDLQFGSPPTPSLPSVTLKKDEPNPLPSWFDYLQVRDQGLPKSIESAGPAVLGVTRDNGKESTVAKASILYTGPAFKNGKNTGWYPFASINIDRNLAINSPKNKWDVKLGTHGTLLDYSQTGIALDTVAFVAHKRDNIAANSSNIAAVDFTAVVKGLATQAAWQKDQLTYQILPSFGVNYQHNNTGKLGEPQSTYATSYIGLSTFIWPGNISSRLKGSAKVVYFRDIHANSGFAKRSSTYSSFAIDYYLFDPTTEKPVFTPILGLLRESGTDPVQGESRVNRISLNLKFKLN